ncbi:hypothetical protein BD414DRAFT_495808 [Trametes punicea]|nr:hypothetical protein BD414DRAFT_495808 [Trametes punicea]
MPRTRLTNIPGSRTLKKAIAQSKEASESSPPAIHDVPVPPADLVRYRKGRSKKAERDEVMDIARALREVKTYRGGFTRPSELRITNWFPGGPYDRNKKVYEAPDPDAYTPRTVFVLEGRYPSVLGQGRVDAYPVVTGVCKEGSLHHIVEIANSPRAGNQFTGPMDSARWPWDKPMSQKRVRWWDEGENPKALRREANEDGSIIESLAPSAPSFAVGQARAFHTSAVALLPDDPNSHESRKNIPTSSWSRPPRPSQDAHDDVVPTYYVERKKQRDQISQRKEEEGSLMAELNAGILSEGLAAKTRTREEKIPVEVRLPDGKVAHPSGFTPPTPETEFHPVAAKVPTEDHPLVATVKQPWDEREFQVSGAKPIVPDPQKEQEWVKRVVSSGGTGQPLTGVRDISAEKPAPGSAQPTSTEDRSKIATSAWDTPTHTQNENDPDSVVPPFYIERKKQRDQIAERKEEEGGLMAELNAGILSENLAAQTREREEKIPVEVPLKDGTIVHPSGFEPPTPETEFHPVAAKPPDSPKLPWTEVAAVKEGTVSSSQPGSAKKPGDVRGFHTSAVTRAHVLPHSIATPLQRVLAQQGIDVDAEQAKEVDPALKRRERYMPTLAKEPFWRPLITVTVSTRPLADALHSTSLALPRGLPFYSSIDPEERKNFWSFNSRMRNLRLNRLQKLTYETAIRLHGRYGGFVGLRLHPQQRGRGWNGESLADGIPKEKRMIKVGVGEWYPFAEELKERFLADAEEGGYSDCIEVFGVDEWGNRTDGQAPSADNPQKGADMASLMESDGSENNFELDVD